MMPAIPHMAQSLWMPDELQAQFNGQRHRVHPNKVAGTNFTLQNLLANHVQPTEYIYDGEAAHAAALVKPAFVLNGFSGLHAGQGLFREFFAQLCGSTHVEHVFFVKVRRVVKLRFRMLPGMKCQSFITGLPRWFAQTLVDDAEMASLQRLPEWLTEEAYQIEICVAKPFAATTRS